MKIASWNVRTLLYRDGTNRPERRSALVAAELQRYEIDVAGLQETRFSGSGQLRESNYTFFWSGRPEGERRQSGVALVIRNSLISKMESAPIAVSDRLIFLKTGIGRGRHACFICAYAPTLDSNEDDKTQFYRSLEELLNRVNHTDKLVLVGDFNARVGSDLDTWQGVLGHFGRRRMNDNGLLLAMKCSEHDLAITNTYFRVPDKWYGSWQHPRSKHVHLLDYIITKRKDMPDFHSTRVVRGAECGTDHGMVRSVVAFRLKTVNRTAIQQRSRSLDMARLHNAEVRRQLQSELDTKLRLHESVNENSIDSLWTQMKETIREVAEDTLGFSKRGAPDCFSENEE